MCSPCFICPFGSPSCCYLPCPSNSEHKCIPANPAPQCPSPCPPSCPPPCFPSCPSLCPPPPCPSPGCPPPSCPPSSCPPSSGPPLACPPRACPSCPKCCKPPPKQEISFVSYPVCPSPSCPPPRLNPCPSRVVCFSSCNSQACCPSKCQSEIELKPCKSYEFIGGTFILGCDCGKHNGLQDNCRRTECRGSAICRARQWACCRPSKFTGGKHLASKFKERE